MAAGTRAGIAVVVALLAIGAAVGVESRLSGADASTQSTQSIDQAKGRAQALRETLRSEVDRLLRTAVSAASVPALRKMVESNADQETFADFFLNEDEWAPYRTAPMTSALFLGGTRAAQTGSEGLTGKDVDALVESAEVAGKSELLWAGDALFAVSAVKLPIVMRGEGPKGVVIVIAKKLVLTALDGTWMLTDGQRVLAKHGAEADLNLLMGAVGHEKEGTHPLPSGGSAALDLMPGVWVWAFAPGAAAAASGSRGLAVYGGGALLALVALFFGFKKGAPGGSTLVYGTADPGLDRTAMSLPAASPSRTAKSNAPQPPSRYKVVAPLGEGGMARVFLAVTSGAEGFKRAFVVKRLRPELLVVPESVTQFIDEARLGSSLVHSNIVPVFDFGRDAEGYYLAQEYIQGRDFDHVRKASLDHRRRPIEPELVLYVAREALHALSYVHTRTNDAGQPAGLVHRDVSPNNLMISARGEVKLLDLGIAKSDANLTRTQAGVVKGNVFYMAPEQARGEPVDGRADLFSLGLVMFTACTGDTLYQGASNYELLNHAANGLGEQDWKRIRSLPPAVAKLLERALQAEAADRFATADEFAQAIDPAAVGTAKEMQALMQSFFADEFRREQETLQEATKGT